MTRRKSVFAPAQELSQEELKPRRLGEDGTGAIEIADWKSLPEDLVLNAELRDTFGVRSASCRRLIGACAVEGMTTDETAEVLEIGTDLVTRLHRGRLTLRQSLDEYLRGARMHDHDCGQVFRDAVRLSRS